MTPFENPTTAEVKYNKLLKKERVIVERCFGQLKRRFPTLQYVFEIGKCTKNNSYLCNKAP